MQTPSIWSGCAAAALAAALVPQSSALAQPAPTPLPAAQAPATNAPLASDPARAQRTARLAAFRTFASHYLGEWDCFIEEFDASSKVVWSDRQRRIFSFSMSRQFLEERAILKQPNGTEYEGGLHLTTWDPRSDAIVQHGYWLPRQPEPLFRLEGKVSGNRFSEIMALKQEDGSVANKPLMMVWDNPDRWRLEVTGKAADGSTFLNERLTYTRRPKG